MGLRTVFLTSPYGQVGGGMGSIMLYLASLHTDQSGRYRLVPLESRGGGRLIMSPFFLATAALRILGEALLGRLAVVHLNLAERGSIYRKGFLLFVAKLVGARVLLHLHAAQILAQHRKMAWPARYFLRSMFRSADRVVVLGELWRRWAVDSFGLTPQAVTVVRNGVPATMVPRVERAPGEPFRLLFLGNLLQRKGIADLLHALSNIADPEIVLTVAGGGAIETYRQMAESLGIASQVRFTGWVDQSTARNLIAESDALVLPAYDEGLPLVILEALATGVPVICTPVGAIPEVFRDRQNALLVTPGDRPALGAAITTLRDDPALQDCLSAGGLALYRQEFTMEVFAARMSALYAALDQPRAHRDQVGLGRVAEAGDDR
jgi:glycosyltransferase involved in cell wall biosynthesis